MRSLLPLCSLSLILASGIAAHAQEGQWQTLFDGETLEGWHNPYEWGEATAKDGEIQLLADKKFFLLSDEAFGDFEMTAEIKVPEGKSNSGFMLRANEETNRVFGYQAEVDPSERRWAGGLYDEGRRGWLNPLEGNPKAQAAFDREIWNRYRILCEGDHLRIFVNDTLTTDYRDPVDLFGPVGLQHHGESGQVYRFRKLRIRDNGRHHWQPLFNGHDLTGWTAHGGGDWRVEDGAIIGTSSAQEQQHGLLAFDQEADDFTVRLKFRVRSGNSGFYFRSQLNESSVGIAGIQAEIEDGPHVGGLYETGGRGWIVQPLHYLDAFASGLRDGRRKDWQQVLQSDAWRTLVVSAHRDRIVVHVDNVLACDLTDPKGRRHGVFALQLHGGQDMHVEFKDIQTLVKAP